MAEIQLCVFCGSHSGRRPQYEESAKTLGKMMAERGIGLVYGGGHVGIMGAVADAVIDAGGEAVGVMPRFLVDKEIAHKGLKELIVVESMHMRKAILAEFASGFIGLPGGFGTLEEFCEVVTWAQLGLHQKPMGLLNVEGFFDPFLAFAQHTIEEGFVNPVYQDLIYQSPDPAQLLDHLTGDYKPVIPKWTGRAPLEFDQM